MSEKKPVFILRIVLLLAFLFFGIAKFLVSPEQAAGVFGDIGGTPAQYFTAVYQIVSAILVIIPSTAFIGALLMAISMAVAVVLHIFVLGFEGPFLFLSLLAVVIFLLALYVMKNTRSMLFRK